MRENTDDIERTMMLGAACGDVAGSVYEWQNIDYRLSEEELIAKNAYFTDDTVLTCAVAKGIREALSEAGSADVTDGTRDTLISRKIVDSLVAYARRYPHAGYGGTFRRWVETKMHLPYNSWGNGSAMRVSYAGWAARSLEEAEYLAALSAAVTHNHPEGIKGARAVAGSIFVLRNGGSKEDVREYIKKYYSINFTLDEIRADYSFHVSCQESVPQALEAFLEGESFAEVLSLAISIGGDSDTIAAIAGSIAEVIYPIPLSLRRKVMEKLDGYLRDTLIDAAAFAVQRNSME